MFKIGRNSCKSASTIYKRVTFKWRGSYDVIHQGFIIPQVHICARLSETMFDKRKFTDMYTAMLSKICYGNKKHNKNVIKQAKKM
jgi:hypothetical protein